jgi:hypothetical protein
MIRIAIVVTLAWSIALPVAAEPPVTGTFEVVSVRPTDAPPVLLAEQIKEANPQIHWLRIVWAFAADHCSVRGHFLSHDSVFGDYACDVAVDFDPRWEDDKLVVPMSVAARSEFRRFTRREVGRDDLVDTDERICNVSIPAGTFVFEQVDDGLMLINESTGEALHLIPTDFDPAYTWRLPSP